MTWFYPDCEFCGGVIHPEWLDGSEEWMGWCVMSAGCDDCGSFIPDPLAPATPPIWWLPHLTAKGAAMVDPSGP